MRSIGFLSSDEDHYLYSKDAPDGSPIFLILYVDDMLLNDTLESLPSSNGSYSSSSR